MLCNSCHCLETSKENQLPSPKLSSDEEASLHQVAPFVRPNFPVLPNFTTPEKWCKIFIFVLARVPQGTSRQYHCGNNSPEKMLTAPRIRRNFIWRHIKRRWIKPFICASTCLLTFALQTAVQFIWKIVTFQRGAMWRLFRLFPASIGCYLGDPLPRSPIPFPLKRIHFTPDKSVLLRNFRIPPPSARIKTFRVTDMAGSVNMHRDDNQKPLDISGPCCRAQSETDRIPRGGDYCLTGTFGLKGLPPPPRWVL